MVMCGEAFLPVMTPLVQQCCSSPVSQQAVEVMCFVPKRCDDMMSLGRLRGFEVWAPARKPQFLGSGLRTLDPYKELPSEQLHRG